MTKVIESVQCRFYPMTAMRLHAGDIRASCFKPIGMFRRERLLSHWRVQKPNECHHAIDEYRGNH